MGATPPRRERGGHHHLCILVPAHSSMCGTQMWHVTRQGADGGEAAPRQSKRHLRQGCPQPGMRRPCTAAGGPLGHGASPPATRGHFLCSLVEETDQAHFAKSL